MAAGGFFFFPLSHMIGRSSAIFWSLIGTMLSQVWASQMTHTNDYTPVLLKYYIKADGMFRQSFHCISLVL
jgi:hypothetical protein